MVSSLGDPDDRYLIGLNPAIGQSCTARWGCAGVEDWQKAGQQNGVGCADGSRDDTASYSSYKREVDIRQYANSS